MSNFLKFSTWFWFHLKTSISNHFLQSFTLFSLFSISSTIPLLTRYFFLFFTITSATLQQAPIFSPCSSRISEGINLFWISLRISMPAFSLPGKFQIPNGLLPCLFSSISSALFIFIFFYFFAFFGTFVFSVSS